MKFTLQETEEIVDRLSTALTYAKQARRTAKKVYGNEREITANLKYAYLEIQQVTKVLEGGA